MALFSACFGLAGPAFMLMLFLKSLSFSSLFSCLFVGLRPFCLFAIAAIAAIGAGVWLPLETYWPSS